MHPLPVVKFHVSPEQTVERKLGLESWTVEVGGQKKAERKQVPLKLVRPCGLESPSPVLLTRSPARPGRSASTRARA